MGIAEQNQEELNHPPKGAGQLFLGSDPSGKP
jgi:hypothetical protein